MFEERSLTSPITPPYSLSCSLGHPDIKLISIDPGEISSKELHKKERYCGDIRYGLIAIMYVKF